MVGGCVRKGGRTGINRRFSNRETGAPNAEKQHRPQNHRRSKYAYCWDAYW